MSDAADLGGSFSFVESLFSGLAFAGVIIAIYLQSEELRLQRKELKLTNAELKKSAEAQDAMQKSMKLTAYLSAASVLAESLSESITLATYHRFSAAAVQHTRLTSHLDWLLNEIRLDHPTDVSSTNCRSELLFAVNALVTTWDRWSSAIGANEDHEVNNGLSTFVSNLRNLFRAYADAPNIVDGLVLVENLEQLQSDAVKSATNSDGLFAPKSMKNTGLEFSESVRNWLATQPAARPTE